MKCGIYKITNNITKQCYIGQSKNILNRWKSHIAYADNYKYNYPLYIDMRKYGISAFSFEILELCIQENLNVRELYWINKYDSYNSGYNNTPYVNVLQNSIGENHHNHKLTRNDVIDIRTRYMNHERKYQVYQLYKHKIKKAGFAKIWCGYTWKNIMPEIYTQENIDFHASYTGMKGQDNPRCKLKEYDVKNIRMKKSQGYNLLDVYKDYQYVISKKYFSNIWYGINWNQICID